MAKYRDNWHDAVFAIINVAWRPHLLAVLLFEAMLFGFGIGINVSQATQMPRLLPTQASPQTTNAVFLGTPEPAGYGFSPFGIAGAYGTPIVSCIQTLSKATG